MLIVAGGRGTAENPFSQAARTDHPEIRENLIGLIAFPLIVIMNIPRVLNRGVLSALVERDRRGAALPRARGGIIPFRRIFGKTAPAILEIEKKAGKNDPEKHRERLARTLAHWDEIHKAMEEELPDLSELIRKMRMIGEPVKPSELGISLRDTVDAFVGSRDLRDKFLTSSLLWDLGEMEDYAKILEEEAEQ